MFILKTQSLLCHPAKYFQTEQLHLPVLKMNLPQHSEISGHRIHINTWELFHEQSLNDSLLLVLRIKVCVQSIQNNWQQHRSYPQVIKATDPISLSGVFRLD